MSSYSGYPQIQHANNTDSTAVENNNFDSNTGLTNSNGAQSYGYGSFQPELVGSLQGVMTQMMSMMMTLMVTMLSQTSYRAGGFGNSLPHNTGNSPSTPKPTPVETPMPPKQSSHSLGTDAQVDGNKIVLSNGQNFNVHGINIGGYLVPEDWMDGTKSGLGNDGRSGYQLLVKRFGQEQADKLIKARQNNWITPSDLQNIKSIGYNTIRVPFSYQSFPKKADGSYDFSAMDHIVKQAGALGLHVIPDFHVWEGQDQDYKAISGNSAEGAQERQNSSDLLKAFAQHYKGNGTILAIDEDNEATGSPNDQLQKQLYKAIREGDSNRAVMIESVSYGNFSKDGFTNAIFSSHYPPMDSEGLSSYINKFSDHARPVVIGEMHGEPDQVGSAVKQLNATGIGWINWNYKGVNVGNWALENLPASHLDLQTATYEEIQQAWSKQSLQNTKPNTALINAYQEGL